MEQFTGGDIICDGLFSYLVYGGFFICGSLIVKEKYRRSIFLLFSGVTSWLSVIELLQETKNSFILYCFPTMRSAVFQNLNYFGYVLCMSIIVLLGLYLYDEHDGPGFRILYLFQYTLQVIALLVNNTFGSYLAVVVAIPVLYLFYHKNGRKISGRLLIPVLIFVLLSFVNFSGAFSWFGGLNSNFTVTAGEVGHIAESGELSDHAGSGRGALWKDAIQRIKARPVTGFGPEGFAASPQFLTEGSPHNDFLQVAGYLGIPGLALYLAALITLAVYLCKHLGELSSMVVTGGAVVVCYMVSAFFGHPVYNTTPYFWMILGMITVKNEQDIPFLQVREYTEGEKQKKYLLPWAGCALLCIICLCTGLVRTFGLDEKMNEVSDLQAMRCAELTAIMELRKDDCINDGTEYWFDITEFKLIPVNEPAPQSFGTGTDKTGRGYARFTEEVGTGYNYDYDEAADYTGKILKVIIDDAEKEKLSVVWVTP